MSVLKPPRIENKVEKSEWYSYFFVSDFNTVIRHD